MNSYKNDFPIFKKYPELVYLDSAATSQKPQTVIDAVTDFYTTYNANIHRGIYDLSQAATEKFENTRKKVSEFINANNSSEIIFTSGATEALNVIAFGWAKKFLKKGDIVVLSVMEHHSNIVPWIRLREEIGIELVYLPITKDYRLDYKKLDKNEFKRIKLVSLTHASNVLGTINPIKEIIGNVKKINLDIKTVVDASQTVMHMPVNVNELNCDFLVFSSHKMLGPSGLGVLYGKKPLLEEMDPLIVGSHMIKKVTKEHAAWADVPDKFEAGTRNLEGVIGLGAAIAYIQNISFTEIKQNEEKINSYMLKKFDSQKNIQLYGPQIIKDRVGVFSFAIAHVHPHDVSEILNRSQIAVRAGHHCAQPLMDILGVSGTVRASLYIYNTLEDIDRLFEGIEEVKKVFNI